MEIRDEATGQFTQTDVLERFWAYVKIDSREGCWTWLAATIHRPNANYGRFWTGEREVKAHRFSYELHIGPIPDGLQVLHTCDNPPCVNPDHLFLGTHDDNMADKLAKGRNCYGDANGSRRHPERRPRGETSPRAVISDVAARRLHTIYHAEGVRQVDLAKQFAISQSLVSEIVRGAGRFRWLS